MSCLLLALDSAGSMTFLLTLSADDTPATGLDYTDVAVALKKEGAGTFTPKVLTAPDFVEIGSGFYQLNLSAADLDTEGTLYVKVTGSTVNTELLSATIVESVPTVPSTAPSVPQSTIYGYLLDPGGSPVSGATVGFRVLAQPLVVHPGLEGIGIGTGLVTAQSDASGFFSVDLIVGADVDVFIPAANYRRTFRVPSSNTNLFDIE